MNKAVLIIYFKCVIVGHRSNKCRIQDLKCSKCYRNGHVDNICRSTVNHNQNGNRIHSSDTFEEKEVIEPYIQALSNNTCDKINLFL